MSDSFFQEIEEELRNGVDSRAHPFHYFTLATLGVDNIARQRIVALRKVSKKLKLTFFTDKRSKKMIHIKENKRVSLLFYHPDKLLQLRVQGIASVRRSQKRMKNLWFKMGPQSKKSYTTKEAPGSTLENQTALEYLNEGNYFSVVEIEPYKIEYLKLSKPEHVRIRYSKESNSWQGEFLVP
jgi:pyridoxine/pyridoxamine 5'-phosphate oxidase